jgi:AraC family transcriptional regulator of adaptative response/methylated-DNA-[protein]-cysteine methyltransferase
MRAAPSRRAVPPPPPPSPDDARWQAVLSRDRAAEGAFVYAVRTTGIYCRPTCPSRRPRRENVSFHATPAEAERAGFRACLRCGPDAPAPAGGEAVARAAAFLSAHPEERTTLAELARRVGLSPFHLQRTFRRATGLSPRAYQEAARLARFKAEVRRGAPVGLATYEAGFGSSRALYESARDGLGMTPGRYRRGGEGEVIRFATLPCALGRLLVAATERGVCAVSLGAADGPLEAELRAEFPRAELARDEHGVSPWAAAVLRHVEAAGAPPPLDLRGTAFQLRVWQALREIPRGETRSYGEVARTLGAPGSARAVARACASNRVALVVPCHRVVRGGGEAGGYRWGAELKRRLLEREEARRR